ncbi:MAG: molybdopterin molybdotransferase MoeA [Clostridia bacterium]
MEFFSVQSVESARRKIVERLDYLNQSEVVDTCSGLGRVLFCDVIAKENVPSFDKSTVDGYAVLAVDTYGASESGSSLLKLVGSVTMGVAPTHNLRSGEAMYVPTGGMLPNGANAVVMIEHTDIFGESVAVLKSVHMHENTLNVGEDTVKGAVICKQGKKITPMTVGALASQGIAMVEVFKQISAYIISTGNELVDIADDIKLGQIRDINSFLLSSLCEVSSIKVVGCKRVKDDFDLLRFEIEKATKVADIILISGGSSVGEKDFTYRAICSFGEDAFVKGVAIKPGKPTIVGSCCGKLVFGLPGHPMAAAVVYKMLVEQAINLSRGISDKPKYLAETSCNFPSTAGRLTCQPVKCSYADGKMTATALFGKSGQINLLDEADGFVVIQENIEGINRGQTVEVFSFTN